ncbi:MAG: SGNH/GDSL hydrolase family protein [Lachnospiraceae bacterium]|nr:SGNH/GDSL hydrolase family protein [Lachnospiraceae bacterium]MDE6185547.1 SGNH/GDSL hydrolase family protein [Lachnospiraceae bacterium]MDE7285491.1 SGNH/GDSL hydrolase family protein [Lachnospiraceae bacterium]
MRVVKSKECMCLLLASVLAISVLVGCGRKPEEKKNEEILPENIVITETGEVIEEETLPSIAPISEATATPEIIMPEVLLQEPEQEQVITEEDQREPQGKELQLVFLGDSIFDANRDGTGVPYLTSVACEADVFNLAIGGTCAAIEYEESAESAKWTSTSLVGVVKAIMGDISTDIFSGKATKDILDNPNIDFSQTDYFIVEYGMNDFFRATPLDSADRELFDLRTYAGALRYAVDNLREVAPDATIILCSPNYAQFYDGTWMIGDGNTVNTGYGTLFDYKGICNYVANEKQALFFNAYQDLGIDGYTAEEYLEDGVHLTEAGRRLYAEALAHMILSYEETKNN